MDKLGKEHANKVNTEILKLSNTMQRNSTIEQEAVDKAYSKLVGRLGLKLPENVQATLPE